MYSDICEKRICQGDILENFIYDLNIPLSAEIKKIRMSFPYVIVLSQDCDLTRDYEIRFTEKEKKNYANQLFTVLICPLFNAEIFREGNHLSDINIQCDRYNSERWQPVKNNENPRLHFLSKNEELAFPDLILDFKYFYTFPIEAMYEIKEKIFKAKVADLYKESVSQRFSNYLARVALPDQEA